MLEFHGLYTSQLKEYIAFKRNLGYRYASEYTFRTFDRFTIEQGCTTLGLTREICELWAIKRPNESDTTCYHRVNTIRNFSVYLSSSGFQSYVPRQVKNCKTDFVPYIFSKEEIQKFFSSCDSLPISGYSNTTWVLPALFRLVYGCGLRISEALSLKCKDVDLQNQFIVVRETKNGCDRILPYSDSVAVAMEAYWCYREKLHVPEEYFFVKKNGDCCEASGVYKWFRKILYNAEISHGGRGIGPRIHDFRHSFSVHTLTSMAESGLDLYYSLPILSKYLGHKSLEATDKYVRLTADIYPEILKEMDAICAYVFPEVRAYEA